MAHDQPVGTGIQATACSTPGRSRSYSRHAVFDHCPQCGGEMAPEHAHYRCGACGWRDSCCD